MKIKILNSLPDQYNYTNRNNFIIGTHNGIFHSDEVVATAILCLQHNEDDILIVRTRDMEILSKCDICVDIGGGSFDHHQAGFDLSRTNGIPYASAGLVWNVVGKHLIHKYSCELFPDSTYYNSDIIKIFDKFDEKVISLVDCEDNGIKADKHCFSFIPSFLPLWNKTSPDFNKNFLEVLKTTIKVLEHELTMTIAAFIAKTTLISNWKNPRYFSSNILEIPCQTIPWIETLVSLNEVDLGNDKVINFVVFPYPDGGWAAQCVPPSLEKKFEQRIPFPKEWAGQTDALAKICTVEDAILCHKGLFFTRAKTKEGIISMCKLAMHDNI